MRAKPAQLSTSSACPNSCRRTSRKASYYKVDQAAPIAKIEDLANYDAIVVGTGTRFGRIASQMANFLDQAGGLWAKGALHGKVGGAFTSSATQHGGQETTLFSIITNLLHFGMVGGRTQLRLRRPDGRQGSDRRLALRRGPPSPTATAAASPARTNLLLRVYQGKTIAETAKKLHG